VRAEKVSLIPFGEFEINQLLWVCSNDHKCQSSYLDKIDFRMIEELKK
jgi:hypothetical protein